MRNDFYLTKLVIYNFHECVYHNSTVATLNRLRTEYWVIQGRQSVKHVLKEYIACKYANKKPAQPVATPELPDYRVQCNHAFEVVGIDYAGPLFCKDIFSSNDDVHKCYILLFPCAFSRAVHLEITSDLKAGNLLLALKRFISRRGKSTKFISDNGKTFKRSKLKSFLIQKNIKKNFILEKAPWWGGFYKELIGIVKNSLKKLLEKSLLTYEELYTVITKTESVMNSRPLTCLSEEEYQESLIPNHLIYGTRYC